MVTVLMSDIRGYSTIAEDANPTVLARQLNEHRAEMNRAILAHTGTVMQFVGDSVMAVFGAPLPEVDHARRALDTARAMHDAQTEVNSRWATERLPPFDLGIGLSTGEVAAALLGSEERVEYSLVGNSVNLCQRLQQFAKGGETILSEATYGVLEGSIVAEALPPTRVKAYGRRGRKNDRADAAACCEAVTRPSMCFVPIKAPDQQAALMLPMEVAVRICVGRPAS